MEHNQWMPYEDGTSIEQEGSENGVIIEDEIHPLGARMTLEKEAQIAPYSITCGIFGIMAHTCFFSDLLEAKLNYAQIKMELVQMMRSPDDSTYELIKKFVNKY